MVVPVQNPTVMGYFEPTVMGYSDVVNGTYWPDINLVLTKLKGTSAFGSKKFELSYLAPS